MNKFVLSQESNDKLVVDNKVEGSEDNYIPLKVVGKNFNKPISEILEENVDKHWAVNLREEGTNTLYTSITGDGMLSGEFSSAGNDLLNDYCKDANGIESSLTYTFSG